MLASKYGWNLSSVLYLSKDPALSRNKEWKEYLEVDGLEIFNFLSLGNCVHCCRTEGRLESYRERAYGEAIAKFTGCASKQSGKGGVLIVSAFSFYLAEICIRSWTRYF